MPGMLRRREARYRFRLALTGAIYVVGAVGVEMAEGSIAESSGELSLTYSMSVIVQEFMEMTGVILFVLVLLTLIRDRSVSISVPIES